MHRERAGLSQARLADLAGTSQANIAKLERTGRINAAWAVRLAAHLDCKPIDLVSTGDAENPAVQDVERQLADRHGVAAARGGVPPVGKEGLPGEGRCTKIPVLSAARGGVDQEMFLEDGPIDWIDCPTYLQNVKAPYAVWVVGDSMMPRYRPAQILHVNPFKPPAPGSGVVVSKRNQAVLIKEYVRDTPEGVVLREYQPALREFTVPVGDLDKVHTVVGLQEP